MSPPLPQGYAVAEKTGWPRSNRGGPAATGAFAHRCMCLHISAAWFEALMEGKYVRLQGVVETETPVRCMVRAKGLEPPQAVTYQDLNLGRFIPSCPVLYQGVQE